MNRSLLALMCTALMGCVDTTPPDLSSQLGGGRTAGPYCTVEQLAELPERTLRIHVIDVGQGDAIWIQTPWFVDQELETRNILVDAGPSGQVDGTGDGGSVVVSYLLEHGLNVGDPLDAVVVTHAHEDHYGGLATVLSTFTAQGYIDPGYDGGSDGFIAARTVALGQVNQGLSFVPAVPSLAAAVPATLNDDVKPLLFGSDVLVSLLWASDIPVQNLSEASENTVTNNTSVVLSLGWAGRQVLLMGDAEEAVEEALLSAHDQGAIDLESDVLKVGHHGSNTSSSEAFLEAVLPSSQKEERWAVISSGKRSFGGTQLPADDTVERLANHLEPYHLLSTENRDEDKSAGEELGDDHILIQILPNGAVEACYGQ
ncbi:MAG: MBL fold metallo-hydrolase [Myxococcota bacterium]|nr:MBL fold metallo-hydrolase [Myxococcota bacterium]